MDDANFAGDLSRLIGDHDVRTTSYGSGRNGNSRNRATRRGPILSAADIRALRKGTALLFATGSKPALIKLTPWYTDKRWKDPS
jgi:type IV secretory pathway TraG/TraD family ATPase VirD4